jgi:DNA-directed RNA polymerase specialized sigma24 family protein
MARIPMIEDRLQRWGQAVTVGDGSGYPMKNPMHPTWQPPTSGITPTLKTAAAGDAKATHRAIARLSSDRLIATVTVHYACRWPIDRQAAELGCEASTVHDRIGRAHKELARMLDLGNDAARVAAG